MQVADLGRNAVFIDVMEFSQILYPSALQPIRRFSEIDIMPEIDVIISPILASYMFIYQVIVTNPSCASQSYRIL